MTKRLTQTLGIIATTFAVVSVFSVARPARADQQTFAQFDEVGRPSPQDFSYNSTTGIFGTVSPIQVSFTFETANNYDTAGTPITAWLTMTATSLDDAAKFGKLDNLDFDNVTISINTNSAGTGDDLLTLETGATGSLFGTNTSHAGTFEGDNTSGDTVRYKSDNLVFAPSSAESYSLSLTSITPSLLYSSGNLASFTAAATGGFASDPLPTPAPEASSFVSFGAMLLVGGVVLMRRRTVSTR